MNNVHSLFPKPSPFGHYIRIGHTGYRILEDLHAAGRFPIRRAVFDASHPLAQIDWHGQVKGGRRLPKIGEARTDQKGTEQEGSPFAPGRRKALRVLRKYPCS